MASILVIDDNRANLDLMLYLLRAFGHTVTGAGNALAGLEAARAGEYDAILTDILMPDIDGFELARRFKEDARWRGTPLVAVTALVMVGDRERALAAGFDGYIPKPIDPQQFVRQVDAFLPEKVRSSPARPRKSAKILVVDDDAANRLLVRTLLEHAGHAVIEAADGADGLRLARDRAPELIVIDLYMPRMSGAEFIKTLRADPALRGTKVVLYTGTRVDAAMRDFMHLSRISHVISKPSEPADVLRIVSEALAA